jgi:hypothetical protein
MAKYSYKYSGSNAAFVLSGICTLPSGISVIIEEKDHKTLSKNKFVKYLLETGELKIDEVQEETKPTTGGRGGKGGKQTDAASEAAKAADEAALAAVKAELAAIEVTFSEDETLEQLQAKLVQATE